MFIFDYGSVTYRQSVSLGLHNSRKSWKMMDFNWLDQIVPQHLGASIEKRTRPPIYFQNWTNKR